MAPMVAKPLSRFYDRAAGEIDLLVEQRLDAGNCGSRILGQANTADYDIFEETAPHFYKVVYAGTTEEAVFRLVGAVTSISVELPQRPMSIDELRHNAQHIAITGFKSKSFAQGIDGLNQLHWRMRRQAGRDVKEPRTTPYENAEQMHFKCRLFTTGDDATSTATVPPAPYVDRGGWIMYHVQDSMVCHGEDNRVFYDRKVERGSAPISPSAISIGDIVEVEFTILGVPTRGGVVFLLVQSRVLVLDSQLEQDACMKEYEYMRNGRGLTGIQMKAKRRRADEEEEVALARKRMARLSFDEDTSRDNF